MNSAGTQKSKSRLSDFSYSRIDLSGNWHGLAADNDSMGNGISAENWTFALKNPLDLFNEPMKVLKGGDSSSVISREMAFGNNTLKVVVKSQKYGSGSSDLFSSLMRAKSLRNFNTAVRLCNSDIPTARPLAALWQKKGARVVRSIFISEYVPDSDNLYMFIYGQSSEDAKKTFAVKKQMAVQTANLLACLHKAGLWHRDAKAANFLVRKLSDGQPYLMLVDMDGIKPYLFSAETSRYRCLSKLASTLMWSSYLSKTDYLRTFTIYCNLTGIEESRRQGMYRRLARRAVGMRLMTFANSVMRQARKGKSKEACQ